MYVITGATGNIGKLVAAELLANGKKVRIIGRNASKLDELVNKGAESFVGDVTDTEFVKNAFEGAEAVYCMIPPNNLSDDFKKYQEKVAKNYYNAVKINRIKKVILLSSIGAHLRKGAGVVDGLGAMESFFTDLMDISILNLRPSYFMENVLGQIGIIKNMGIAGAPVKADILFPIVATKDIAAVVAKRLLQLRFSCHTSEYVLGPRNVSYNEITSIIGKAIGKPDLKYVQFSYEDAVKAFVQSGFCSESVAEGLVKLSEGLNNGSVLNHYVRTASNTTPTTIEEFAETFAYLYNKELVA